MLKKIGIICLILTTILCSCSYSNFKRNTMQPVVYANEIAKCEKFDEYIYTVEETNKTDCYIITFYIEQQNYFETRKFVVWFDDNFVDFCDWSEVQENE